MYQKNRVLSSALWLALIAFPFALLSEKSHMKQQEAGAHHGGPHHPHHPKTPTKKEKQTYLKMGLGGSFSLKGDVYAPLSLWDGSIQGYDSDFGMVPIFEVGFGHDCVSWLTTEISFAYRPHYNYEKFQTPPPDTSSGSLGEKTRMFDFDVKTLLASIFLNGRGVSVFRWTAGPDRSYFYPFIGGGVGISEIILYNFRSVGLPSTGLIDNVPSFASENQYTKRYRFTYQVVGGLAYRLFENWDFNLSYRWFSLSRFRGPSFIRDAAGNAGDVSGLEWRQRLSAHEVFFSIKYYL